MSAKLTKIARQVSASVDLNSMQYHEIVGLAVLIPILIHIILNIKTVRGMTRNFKRIPLNVKICLIVDILLMLTFIGLGVSGVLISKTILTGISASSHMVQTMHKFIAALAVILLGVHVGLHLCRKKIRTSVAVGLTVLALAGGVFGFGTSGMLRWTTAPFTSGVSAGSERPDRGEMPEGFKNGENPEGFSGERPSNFNGEKPANFSGGGHGSSTIQQKLMVLGQFFGIMFCVAMVTAWIVWSKKKLTGDAEDRKESSEA